MIIILSAALAIITIIAIWQTRYIYTLKYRLKQANEATKNTYIYKALEEEFKELDTRNYILAGDYLELRGQYDSLTKEMKHTMDLYNKLKAELLKRDMATMRNDAKLGDRHGLK